MGSYGREGWPDTDFAKALEMLMENKVDIFGGNARPYSIKSRKFYVEPLAQSIYLAEAMWRRSLCLCWSI